MSKLEAPPQVEVKEFSDIKGFFQYINEEIDKLRSGLGELLRRLEETKAKAEMITKLEKILKELAGQEGIGGIIIDLDGISILINPNPKQEFDILVEAIKSMQDRIVHLERIKKNLEPLSKIGEIEFRMEVILRNGIPVSILLKT